ncbi:hypothetical protein P7C73_g3672, partial [Tremellales sp. Uapishka_1]
MRLLAISSILCLLTPSFALPTRPISQVIHRRSHGEPEPPAERRWITALDLEKLEARAQSLGASTTGAGSRAGSAVDPFRVSNLYADVDPNAKAEEAVVAAAAQVFQKTLGGAGGVRRQSCPAQQRPGGGVRVKRQTLKLEVKLSTTQLATSLGNVVTNCMTLVDDPKKKYCQTLLNGVDLASGPAEGAIASGASAAASSSPTAAAVATSAAAATVASVSLSTASSTTAVAATSVASVSSTTSSSLTNTATSASASASDTTAQSPSAASSKSSAATASPANVSCGTALLPQLPDMSGNSGVGYGSRDCVDYRGLAGLTLIVIGFVLWERKKYRAQFRQRKLAEKAAPMGTA